MTRRFSFLSKKVWIIAGIILVVIVALAIKYKDGNGKQTAAVTKADIVQEVAATGKIKPNQEVSLGFDKSGRVAGVYALVGDDVKGGQMIAALESGDVLADLAKAKASLSAENIKLAEIKNTAPASYNNAYKNLDAAIKEGFANADNAVRNRTDQFFKNIPDNPQFEVSFTDGNYVHYFDVPSSLLVEINAGRKEAESILVNWQKRTSNLNSSNLISEADAAIGDLNSISDFLDEVAKAVNIFVPAEYAYETAINGYKTAISAARSEVSAAISSIVTAKDKLNTAPGLGQGGQYDDIEIQEAAVAQARAAVSSLEATLNKSAIRAPFDGIVTLQDAKVGEAVSAGEALVSIISPNQMYIESNISEIHIGKIIAGNLVSITFDAFPEQEFSGKVSYVEPGDVLIDGIVNYKVRISLDESDPKIKSGLTANLKIQTSKKENVLSIPLYAVKKENGQDFVNKIVDNKAQKTRVDLGISGNNGLVEIISGLEEGDRVEF